MTPDRSTDARTVGPLAIAALERAVNRALALDPASYTRLGQLRGEVFLLRCSQPELDLYLLPKAEKLALSDRWEGPVTTAVSGRAADFAKLAGAADPAAELINGALALQGDSAPLIELQQIIAGLELDWEAPLVSALGDVVGHQLAQGLRGFFGWGRQAARSVSRQLEEFIHEEARLAPARLELEDFYRDVAQLQLRVQRLRTRMKKLSRRVTG